MFWPTRQQHFLCESDMQFPTLIVFGERIPFRQEAKKTFLELDSCHDMEFSIFEVGSYHDLELSVLASTLDTSHTVLRT